MAVLTVQQLALAGAVPSYAAAAGGGDSFVCPKPGRTFLHVKNAHSAPQSVIVASQATARSGLAATANTVSVVNATEKMILIDDIVWIDANGSVQLTYSGVTLLTIGVFQI